MGKKVIRLTESELYEIVNKIVNEQKPDNLMPGQPDNPMNTDSEATRMAREIAAAKRKYTCVPNQFGYPVSVLVDKKYSKLWIKCALGIIGRESSFSSGARYETTNILKQLASIVGYDSSLGPAQMKGSTAEDLGINRADLFTDLGALDAAYRLIKKNFNLARSKGYTEEPSNLGIKGSGNATLDIAIAAYNGGSSIMGPWCESIDSERKSKGLKDRCSKIPQDKQVPVKNYIPNFHTERWDGVDITTHGYVKEVSDWIRKMNCF
jgi:hypothetical protein